MQAIAELLLIDEIQNANLFHPNFYRNQQDGLENFSDQEALQHYLDVGEGLGLAPSAMFEPWYYRLTNPGLLPEASPIAHFVEVGRQEGRYGSLAQQLHAEGLDVQAIEAGLIPPPAASRTDQNYLYELALSIISAEKDIGYFSRIVYSLLNPDVINAGMDPLCHYVKYGLKEGRKTRVTLTKNWNIDTNLIKDDKPFIVVGVHEASKTGAPIVGMDLAVELSADYNVIFVSMGDGPLLKRARQVFPVIIVSSHEDVVNRFVVDFISKNYPFDRAIISSSASESFVRALAITSCHITCLVHEFLEYMMPARNVVVLSDLVVFSSNSLLKSWQYYLDDILRPASSVLVLPQPASPSSTRSLSRLAARAEVSRQTGIDLANATLVLGAGQIQIRKGTDIFVQVANQLQRETDKYVSIWIGDSISEFDTHFGIWFHAQVARNREEGRLGVHFEPAGPMYSLLMDAADVFVVSSRLDPLPNVAIDAAARGIPVIAFRGATGLADLAEAGEMDLIEVEYASVSEAVRAIALNARPPLQ
jgi:glycosyltransferase involved in cell wall biosynthesis